MKITKSKLKEMIMQEISVQNSKTKGPSKVPPKSLPKGKLGGKKPIAPELPEPETNLLKCWRSGGIIVNGKCTYTSKHHKQNK